MVYASLLVGCKERPALLEEHLARHLEPLLARGFSIEAERFPRGQLTFFRIGLTGRRSQEAVRVLRGVLAGAVSEFIVGPVLTELVRRTLARCYPELDGQDVDRAAATALGRVGAMLAAAGDEARDRLEEWFSRQPEITVEGFVRFRLGGLLRALTESVHQAAEELLGGREEAGFVAALRAGLESSPTKVGTVHVYRRWEGGLLAGESGGAPSLPPELGLTREEDGMSGGEDALLAALFWLNPARVVLHGDGWPERWEEIIAVAFGRRLERCGRCACSRPSRREGESGF